MDDASFLADLDVEVFKLAERDRQRSPNPLGTGVRVRHRPSGLVEEEFGDRSQIVNRRVAIERLRVRVREQENT